MNSKRQWNLWPKNFKEELNSVAGISGAGGLIISIGSVAIFAGTAALAFSGVGAAIAVGSCLYAGIKAVPPTYQNPANLIGKNISLEQLNTLHPRIEKLGVIGSKATGKTTLKTNLAFEPRGQQRTQYLTAQIVNVPDAPPRYLAILDGAGELFSQQFDVAREADYLCIMLDHNQSNNQTSLSRDRIKQNELLLEQVRNTLSDDNLPRKKWIIILMNKHDLWENATINQKNQFDVFCNDELLKWKSSNLANEVLMFAHSNENMDDINRFMEIIKNSLRNNV